MKILMFGDVIGKLGVEHIVENLPKMRKKYNADFCVVNGENSASNGITLSIAKKLCNAGADVITMGNHTFSKFDDFCAVVNEGLPIVRPANYPPGTPGFGHIIVDVGDVSIAVINLLGRVFIEPLDCPFRTADSEIKTIGDKAQIILVDLHAEATSEKIAMGYYLDGQVSAIVGTHTHVQTADERIYPNGTGFISDLGMVGPTDSILGANKEIVLRRIVQRVAGRNEQGSGPVEMRGVILEVDENTGKCLSIERIKE